MALSQRLSRPCIELRNPRTTRTELCSVLQRRRSNLVVVAAAMPRRAIMDDSSSSSSSSSRQTTAKTSALASEAFAPTCPWPRPSSSPSFPEWSPSEQPQKMPMRKRMALVVAKVSKWLSDALAGIFFQGFSAVALADAAKRRFFFFFLSKLNPNLFSLFLFSPPTPLK